MLVPTFVATFRWGPRKNQSGLGFTQCSVRHTRLALTTHRVGDFLLRGRPRMLWSPFSFELWGKRGVHGTFHQFQQHLLRSITADDAAHGEARLLAILASAVEGGHGCIGTEVDLLQQLVVHSFQLWII